MSYGTTMLEYQSRWIDATKNNACHQTAVIRW